MTGFIAHLYKLLHFADHYMTHYIFSVLQYSLTVAW
jgi:hypothetical protein